jgi:hypothetical protein
MRKTLVAVAVIAAGALAYYQFGDRAASKMDIPGLAYVPADTALFSAQATPVDFTSYLTSIGMGPQYYDEQMQQLFSQMSADASEAQHKFLLDLTNAYMKALATPEQLSAMTGVKAKMRSMMYMVGVSPVFKIELADEAAFWKLFDAAEQNSGFSHVAQQLNDIKYRQYRFTHEELTIDLLVTVQQGWATLTLSSDKFDAQHLALVLQAEKPEQSLANTSYLADIQQKYQLNAGALAYVSTAQLSQALVSNDGNRLAKNLHTLLGEQLTQAFAEWRTPACKTDVASITNNWPGLFMDSHVDVSDAALFKVSSRLLLPTENKETLTSLSAIRGFVPAHTLKPTQPALFSAAVGLDVAQLAPSLGKIWGSMTAPAYSCQPLADMQQQMQQQNPVAALAMAGMASGLQGVSVTINGVELDPVNSNVKNADALVTISAANARTFFEGLKAFYPPLATTKLPAAGEELDLASLIPEVAVLGVKPLLALSDSHLLLYVGDKAKAQSVTVAAEALQKNGLVSFGMDYGQFFQTLQTAMAATGEPIPAELQQWSGSQMKMAVSLDVDARAIVLNSQLEVATAPAKK